MSLISLMQQTFPGKPKFTEVDVPDMTGKVSWLSIARSNISCMLKSCNPHIVLSFEFFMIEDD
jgi:hypothetical protein